MIGVDPSDSDTVYLGAVDVFRTQDAGTSITQQTFWNPDPGQIPNYVHADIHAIAFHPNDSDTLFIGCDGGIFKSTDGGDTFEHLNNDLKITQYYGFDIHPSEDRVAGGTQDNGTHQYYGDPAIWLEWAGGDGGFTSWDQQMPEFMYGSTPNGGMYGSNDGGLTTNSINLPNTTGALFIQPFTIDPNNGNRMMVGTDNVFYSENARDIATATFIDASGTIGSISATTFSPHSSPIAAVGTTAGRVYGSSNLGTGNTFSQIDSGLPTGSNVTWIEYDPHDATSQTIYVTFSSYQNNRVWKTTDGGTNWSSLHGNLPNIPVFSITVDPLDPYRLFLGTELGLWTTGDNGQPSPTWLHYDYGMAWTRIMQLRWRGDNTMWACTHGRGIYKMTRSPYDLELGTLNDSECDDDGILDHGETVTIPVTVYNRSGFSSAMVDVSCVSSSANVGVNTPNVNFGSIPANGSVTMDFELVGQNLPACLESFYSVLKLVLRKAIMTTNSKWFMVQIQKHKPAHSVKQLKMPTTS